MNNKKTKKEERKSYSPEYKAKVALESLKGYTTDEKLSKVLGLNKTMIASWRKRLVNSAPSLFQSTPIKNLDENRYAKFKDELNRA